jgi:hypothetical protein
VGCEQNSRTPVAPNKKSCQKVVLSTKEVKVQ